MITSHILHAAKIKNNCPECFANDGLEYSFSQEEVSKKLYSKAATKVSEILFSHGCKNTIYPVNWNEDIERVHAYHKKQVHPKKGTIQLTTFGYVLAAVFSAIIMATGFLLFNL